MNRTWEKKNSIAFRSAFWLVTALLTLGIAGKAQGVEFVDPPGQNVKRQEELLKNEVTNQAKSLIGDQLVDVIVHVGYARTENGDANQGKIKLPGFNSFIKPTGKEEPEIKQEFLRIRQVFVVVTKDMESESRSIERDLITQLQFNRKKGDWLEVIVVDMAGEIPRKERKKNGKTPPKETPEEEEENFERLPSPNEPKSTVYLLRARDEYFKKDFDKSLRAILKALAVEPNSAQAYSMLGSLYYRMNWKNLALKYWEKSLSLDPENTEIEELVDQLKDSQL